MEDAQVVHDQIVDLNERESLEQSFQRADRRRAGRISFADFFAMLQGQNPLFSEQEAKQLFRAADKDHDGALDFVEYCEYLGRNRNVAKMWGRPSSSVSPTSEAQPPTPVSKSGEPWKPADSADPGSPRHLVPQARSRTPPWRQPTRKGLSRTG